MEEQGMNDLNGILEQFANLVAARLAAELLNNHTSAVNRRLLSVDQAAIYIGRTKEALQFLLASGKLPTVRSDRRVFLDIRDLDKWIERSKGNDHGSR
jgi:excisionase family DNA binding protein